MSVSLPYDAARFQKADAIMIAYLPRSMPVDPEDKVKEMQQYGPNMPAALYMMISADDSPSAKLPINIPQLDEEYNFTDTVLYQKGFGLTYETEEPTAEPQTTQPTETTEATTSATEAVTIATAATDATSATQKAATSDNPANSSNGNGTVQTGQNSLIIAVALMLIALVGIALYYFRYRKH